MKLSNKSVTRPQYDSVPSEQSASSVHHLLARLWRFQIPGPNAVHYVGQLLPSDGHGDEVRGSRAQFVPGDHATGSNMGADDDVIQCQQRVVLWDRLGVSHIE